jgi:uncharacterized protein
LNACPGGQTLIADLEGILMLKTFIRVSLTSLVLALSQQIAFAAEYTVHDVYRAAEAGRVQEAQAMMRQVLRDHPESAKAHYVEAELYARSGQLDAARRELNTARRLDPTLGFASQNAVDSLQAHLDAAASRNPIRAQSGFQWGYLLLGVGLIAIIAIAMRRLLQRTVVPASTSLASSMPYGGYGPGYAPMAAGPSSSPGVGMGGGLGGGLLGGLATGATVGAGIVAGEALANRFMDGGHATDHLSAERLDTTPPINDWDDHLGGNDFGIDDATSWDGSTTGGDIGGDWS